MKSDLGCVNLKINLQKHALFHRQTNTIKCSIQITQFMITIQILGIKFSTYIFTPSSSSFCCHSSSSSGVWGHEIPVICHWIVWWPAIQKHWMIWSNIPFPLVPIKNVLQAYFYVHIYIIQNYPFPPQVCSEFLDYLIWSKYCLCSYSLSWVTHVCLSVLPNLHKHKLPLTT